MVFEIFKNDIDQAMNNSMLNPIIFEIFKNEFDPATTNSMLNQCFRNFQTQYRLGNEQFNA